MQCVSLQLQGSSGGAQSSDRLCRALTSTFAPRHHLQLQLPPLSLSAIKLPPHSLLFHALPSTAMSVKLKTGADARAMRTVFPPEFKQKVDMSKVKLPLIKVWVQNEVARILGSDDDVVIEMIMGMLEGSKTVGSLRHHHLTWRIR